METNEQIIDSENTTQEQAQKLLSNLCEDGFSGNVEKLALALGRDKEEIQDILDGKAEIDEDLLMKIWGIAQQREVEIE
jgi:hypothetical protein